MLKPNSWPVLHTYVALLGSERVLTNLCRSSPLLPVWLWLGYPTNGEFDGRRFNSDTEYSVAVHNYWPFFLEAFSVPRPFSRKLTHRGSVTSLTKPRIIGLLLILYIDAVGVRYFGYQAPQLSLSNITNKSPECSSPSSERKQMCTSSNSYNHRSRSISITNPSPGTLAYGQNQTALLEKRGIVSAAMITIGAAGGVAGSTIFRSQDAPVSVFSPLFR